MELGAISNFIEDTNLELSDIDKITNKNPKVITKFIHCRIHRGGGIGWCPLPFSVDELGGLLEISDITELLKVYFQQIASKKSEGRQKKVNDGESTPRTVDEFCGMAVAHLHMTPREFFPDAPRSFLWGIGGVGRTRKEPAEVHGGVDQDADHGFIEHPTEEEGPDKTGAVMAVSVG